jgi:4'-phosphopantetheinyl transferase
VRTLLGELLGEAPVDVAIERHCVRCGSADHGKPRLVDASAGIHFSLAHSGPHVVVAVTRAGPVGVDVERRKPGADYRALRRKTLTADEAAAFDAAGGRPQDFLRTWVRKEAVTKAVGTGIASPFHTFAVGERADVAALLSWPDDPSLVERTTLRDLPGDAGRAAAVAVLARDVRVSEHDGERVLRAAVGAAGRGTGIDALTSG